MIRERAVAPAPLRGVVAALAVLLVLLLGLPVAMSMDRAATAATITRSDPSLDPAHLHSAVTIVLVFTWSLHLLVAAAAIWFVIKSLQGRRWARIAFTLLLVAAILGSLNSATAGPGYLWTVVATTCLQLLILALLWLPPSVRAFFATHRAGSSAPNTAGRAT